jgi:hypothetical protein
MDTPSQLAGGTGGGEREIRLAMPPFPGGFCVGGTFGERAP